ncbi:MAG: hypothetical protein JNM27_19265 [Leptospirales bacterium]|nr:hypothetical protein [Leptospirales bacterium]
MPLTAQSIGRASLLKRVILLSCTAIFLHCGTNTNQPVFPLFVFSTVGSPAIVSVTPVQVNTDPLNPEMQFDLKYYITNGEDGFLGYNLYITASSTSAQGALGITTSSGPYLPSGTAPSFSHVGEPASTDPAKLKTQRITDEVPAPGTRQFQYCELYFFRLAALTRSGLESGSSAQVSQCAATTVALCPTGTPCNP